MSSTNVAIYSLTRLSAGTGSVAEIPSVKSISGPNIEASLIEVTHCQSAAKEFKASPLPDYGTIDFTIDFNPKNEVHKMLFVAAQSTSSVHMTETFVDGTVYAMTGSIVSFAVSSENPADSVLTADISYKITGVLTATYV